MKTHIVRSVDPSPLLTEVLAYFDQHCEIHSMIGSYHLLGPLRNGRTVWLKSEKNTGFRFGLRDHFNICMRFIESVRDEYGYTDVGRAYIHRLNPGQSIDKHADIQEKYFFAVDRFQVYLNYPSGLVINHEGVHGPNSLMAFNKIDMHEYINNSKENWYLMVFDLERK